MHRQWHSLSLLSVTRQRLALLSFPLADWTPPPPPLGHLPPSDNLSSRVPRSREPNRAPLLTAFSNQPFASARRLSISLSRSLALSFSFPISLYQRYIRFRGSKLSFEKISKIMEEILKLVFVINYTLCFLRSFVLDSRGSKRFLVSLCNTFSP